MENKDWAEKVLQKYAPFFKHRWQVYNECVKDLLAPEKVWIDCGCGNNEMIGNHNASAMAGGHTHLQMLRQYDGKLIINAGVRLPNFQILANLRFCCHGLNMP